MCVHESSNLAAGIEASDIGIGETSLCLLYIFSLTIHLNVLILSSLCIAIIVALVQMHFLKYDCNVETYKN